MENCEKRRLSKLLRELCVASSQSPLKNGCRLNGLSSFLPVSRLYVPAFRAECFSLSVEVLISADIWQNTSSCGLLPISLISQNTFTFTFTHTPPKFPTDCFFSSELWVSKLLYYNEL